MAGSYQPYGGTEFVHLWFTVHLCRHLKKYDSITEHHCSLQWLPLEHLIQCRCLRSMYQQFHQGHCYRVITKLLVNNIKKSL